MSKEIKFRAWSEKANQFAVPEDNYIRLDGEAIAAAHYSLFLGTEEIEEVPEEVIKDDITIEQYTGVKDKNGKEIYEGDIMSDHSIVRFSDDPDEVGSCGCCVPEFCGTGFIISNDYYPEQLEVIGNIHENPELLEGRK